MHVHITGGHGRKLQGCRQRKQLLQALAIVGAAMQLHRQPQPLGKTFAQPVANVQVLLVFIRNPQGQQSVRRGVEVLA
ncbi:hypothetical protein D3C77_618620 [compost metagenome]